MVEKISRIENDLLWKRNQVLNKSKKKKNVNISFADVLKKEMNK